MERRFKWGYPFAIAGEADEKLVGGCRPNANHTLESGICNEIVTTLPDWLQ